MTYLSEEVKKLFVSHQVFSLATSDKYGMPNVVPVASIKMLDDKRILISDQYMRKTLVNLQDNPYAALSFWNNVLGLQIKGKMEIHEKGEAFDHNAAWMKEVKPKAIPKTALILHIEEVYSLTPGKYAGQRIQ